MKYSYTEVIDIIQNTRRFGTLTGYDVSKRMLEQLGNPQSGIPFVHIAGTNGKGSTTAFLCKILEQTGKKVGMFTSPHLVTFEERIRINGTYISKEDVTHLGNLLLETKFDVSPTMFDYCLAMAVLYFKEQQCDIMVMETGIGGRYDSTNALGIPELAVITKIGFDHTAILGDTLEAIAAEKAGIIKKGCSVVVNQQQPQVREVLLENFKLANDIAGEVKPIQTKQEWEEEPGTLEIPEHPALFIVTREDLRIVDKIPMKMPVGYQIENAATAMLAARVLLDKWNKSGLLDGIKQEKMKEMPDAERQGAGDTNLQFIEALIHKGISETFWKGRMEIINENPFFMIDGAHNSHGVWALAGSLQELYPGEKFHFIMGVMADKDYDEMIDALLPLAVDFITVTPESSRALQSKELAECIQKKGVKARYAENMEAIIRPLLPRKDRMCEKIAVKPDIACIAEENVTVITKNTAETHIYLPYSDHKIIAFGSLYFIGAIESMLEENSK